MSSKSKNKKMLPKRSKQNSNSPVVSNTPIQMLGEIYGDLLPGQKVNIEMKKNR